MYAANIIDDFPRGQFLASFLETLEQTFPYVYLAPLQAQFTPRHGRFTYVVLASTTSLEPGQWRDAITNLRQRGLLQPDELDEVQTVLDLPSLRQSVADWPAVVLTDDYAPVDNMLAPVFRQLRRD